MLSIAFIYFSICGIPPAIVFGILVAWIAWFLVWRLIHQPTSRTLYTVWATTTLLSSLAALCIYVYGMIIFDYIADMPSSPIYEEKQQYFQEAVAEAFQQSIIPPIFPMKACTAEPKIICELGANFTLKLWDSKITLDDDDFPFLCALVSGLASAFTGFVFINKFAED